MKRGLTLAKLGRLDEALPCFDEALRLEPDNDIAWYNKGDTFVQLADYAQAITCYERTAQLSSTFRSYPSLWNAKGFALFQGQHFEDGLACYERALTLDPDNPKALAGEADTLDALKFRAKAQGHPPSHDV